MRFQFLNCGMGEGELEGKGRQAILRSGLASA